MERWNNLPPPPIGKSGWPWTSREPVKSVQPARLLPRISIITPSFNQAEFIEATIRSVLLQDYEDLEYIVIDGGSTDGTLEIIEKYHEHITYFESRKDKGQSHAINKGFKIATGHYTNWICSDDQLCEGALLKVSNDLNKNGNILLLASGYIMNREGTITDYIPPSTIQTFNDLINIKKFWRNGASILQQSCLYPLEFVKKTGFLNENNHYTMDYELWGRLLLNGVTITTTHEPVGIFRWYDGQKTSRRNAVTRSLTKTAQHLIAGNPSASIYLKACQCFGVISYRIFYTYRAFRSALGIKRRLKSLLSG